MSKTQIKRIIQRKTYIHKEKKKKKKKKGVFKQITVIGMTSVRALLLPLIC